MYVSIYMNVNFSFLNYIEIERNIFDIIKCYIYDSVKCVTQMN